MTLAEIRGFRAGDVVLRTLLGLVILLMTQTSCSPAGSDAVRGDTITIDGVDVPLSFEPAEIEVEAGTYTLRFRNKGMLPHQLAIGTADDEGEYPERDSKQIAGGEERTFAVTLEPGRQPFACYVDRHNEAGMTGTLIVRS